ncbi:hypothetical protein [Bacillus siamensis]|uniref:hypothetical protein n=1 Tax=Bacillus siamensis TaxID=659243 RepID=UPI0005F90441|nr:hypothetical protein [Bacillus siamensis]
MRQIDPRKTNRTHIAFSPAGAAGSIKPLQQKSMDTTPANTYISLNNDTAAMPEISSVISINRCVPFIGFCFLTGFGKWRTLTANT